MSEVTPNTDDDEGVDDAEDTSGSGSGKKPWDPGKIRITTKSFSLRDVVQQISDGEIDLAPDFQREYVWSPRQRTRLIESILLGIPLPAFYFNQSADGTYQVVDGVQRLSTIARFMSDRHPLVGMDLEYLIGLHGANYSGLDQSALRRFRSTQIVVHVIEPQTPDEVKFDIFNRVNTLGSPLSSQEVRHAMSKSRSRDFLSSLTTMPDFDAATEHQYWRWNSEVHREVRDGRRMTDRELALRFCAFRNYSMENYRRFESLDAYLNEFTRLLDGLSEDDDFIDDEAMEALARDFERAMKNSHSVLGSAAFRRWPLSQTRRGPINRAIFEAQGNALADYDLESLLERRDEITFEFRRAFDDPRYIRSVTVGTGDVNNINLRLTMTKTILSEIMGR